MRIIFMMFVLAAVSSVFAEEKKDGSVSASPSMAHEYFLAATKHNHREKGQNIPMKIMQIN